MDKQAFLDGYINRSSAGSGFGTGSFLRRFFRGPAFPSTGQAGEEDQMDAASAVSDVDLTENDMNTGFNSNQSVASMEGKMNENTIGGRSMDRTETLEMEDKSPTFASMSNTNIGVIS